MRRNVVPHQFSINHFILCKDGSCYGMACTLHLVSRNRANKNEFYSRIVRASNKVKITSAPSSESLSYVLALNVALQYLKSVYQMFSHENDVYNLFVLGDSQAALQGLYTPPKSILLKSVQSKVLDL